MKALIVLLLSSCLGIYEHTDRLRFDRAAIYKIAIDEDFINKVIEKKQNELVKFSEMIKKDHEKLDDCIEKLCNNLKSRNLIEEKNLEKFRSYIIKEIKIVSLDLKKDIMNVEKLNVTEVAMIEAKFFSLIKNRYIKYFESYNSKNRSKSNLFIKQVGNFLSNVLELKCLPFLFYLKNINYINCVLQENLDRGIIYDFIVDNDINNLQKEIIKSEKKALEFLRIAFISIKDEKVFINFEGYVIRKPKLSKTGRKEYEEVPLYLTEAKSSIEDADTFYLRVPGMINLEVKIKDEVVYFQNIPLKLMKLN